MTIMRSSATNKSMSVECMVSTGLKVAFEIFMRRISWGMMSGKPSTAMMAAFCCARAAIAARKVKMRLRLHPPNNTRPMNDPAFTIGLPRKRLNRIRLSILITSMSNELKSNLARTKFAGDAIE